MRFLLLLALSAAAAAQECVQQLQWSTNGAKVLLNGKPFVLKGVNYFGFETEKFSPHGIWQGSNKDLNWYLDFIQKNNFNAIRVPFSLEMIKNNPGNLDIPCNTNPGLCGKTALEVLDIFIDRAAQRGLLVMLDNHQITSKGGISDLWYNNEYPESLVISLWKKVIDRYQSKWNVFAIDLKNEPHDGASWGNSNAATDWNKAAERFIKALGSFKGFFFVEGIEWGTRLENAASFPLSTGDASLDSRIVYSAHCYGPDVYDRPEFNVANYPNNLDAVYMAKYGFIGTTLNKPIIIGEWGGHANAGTKDATWNNWFVDWLRAKCYTNNFYWCLNPDSGDTGGLLENDWTTPIPHKLALADRAQPNPTKFQYNNGQICITHGTFPEAKCNAGTSQSATTKSSSGGGQTIATTKSAGNPATKAPPGGGGGATGVSVVAVPTSSWNNNGKTFTQYSLRITNNSGAKVCGVTLSLNVAPESKWNLEDVSSGVYRTPGYLTLVNGSSTDQPGLVAVGSVVPAVVSVSKC